MIYKGLVIFALVAFILATIFYFVSARKEGQSADPWRWAGRFSFVTGSVLSVAIICIMAWLIFDHQFQYNYVYSYSSRDLPADYLFSTLWAGQEGSFLLWIFFIAMLGLFLIYSAGDYEPVVLLVFSLALSFIYSMIAGIWIGETTIGSNPFKTIYEAYPGQVPDGFIPPDGRGLNPLLQNYWMTIHPPVLFTGFASALVPFAFALAALWREKYDEWIRPALPWTLWAVFSLGLGIMMGGYWAYETLGWGGYWAWDPVENGSLVPWLALVACIHTMLVQRKTGTLKRFTLFTALFAFIMVVYSTFLTRSGVLADFSVHSFSSLGLYNQLLLFIVAFVALAAGMMGARWKRLPTPTWSNEIFSREFAMISGSLILTLMAIGIIIGTSWPVISQWFGEAKTVDAAGYNQLILPVAVALALIMGMGQLLWFTGTDRKQVYTQLRIPVILTLISAPVFYLLGMTHLNMVLLGMAAIFAITANGQIGLRVVLGNPKLAGGSLAHIGIGVMLIGFITSGKYDTTVTVSLPLNEPTDVFGYSVTWTGDTLSDGKEAYKLKVTREDSEWTLSPIMYYSTYSQAWMKSPDILLRPTYDVYVEPITVEPALGSKDLSSLRFGKQSSIDIGTGKLIFSGFEQVSMDPTDIRFNMVFLYKTDSGTDTLRSLYKIGKDRMVSVSPISPAPGVILAPREVIPEKAQVIASLTIGEDQRKLSRPETLVVQASVKPMIILVWLGTLLTLAGFLLAMSKRWTQR